MNPDIWKDVDLSDLRGTQLEQQHRLEPSDRDGHWHGGGNHSHPIWCNEKHQSLTENDVRRIIREELATFRKVSTS